MYLIESGKTQINAALCLRADKVFMGEPRVKQARRRAAIAASMKRQRV